MTEQENTYIARLHWIIFAWPILFLLASLYLKQRFHWIEPLGTVLILFAIAWFILACMTYQYSSLIITEKQLTLNTGFLMRQSIQIPMNKIESIDIRRSILGAILQYGTLIVTGTGSSRYTIPSLNKPLVYRRYIEERIHK